MSRFLGLLTVLAATLLLLATPGRAENFYGPGDTLAVSVYGMPDLSGEFPVGPGGTLRLPLAGSVSVAGRTLDEIEEAVGQALSEQLNRVPVVMVSAAMLRPVYVVGDVATPGEHPFTPGMTAYTAFAKAGGLPSLHQLPLDRAADAALAERDLLRARNSLHAMLIRREALRAALGGGDITLPQELASMADTESIRALMEQQAYLLEASRQSLGDSQRLLREQHARLTEEIESLQAEARALREQSATVQREVDSMDALAKKGLATNQRMLELSRMRLDLESGRHRQNALLSRARVEKVRLELQYQELVDTWRTERREELTEALTEIDNLRADRDAAAARRALLSGGGGAGLLGSGGLEDAELTFVLRRAEPEAGDQTRRVAGTEPMRPGDVLEVRARSQPGEELARSTSPR